MTSSADTVQANRTIVRAFYEGGGREDIGSFADRLAADFNVYVPEYLPWGGRSNKRRYLDWVLPQVVAVLDFNRLRFDSLTAEGDHVVAFVEIGVKGSDGRSILISEHWDLKDGKATRLRVAYFEPKVLLERLGVPVF